MSAPGCPACGSPQTSPAFAVREAAYLRCRSCRSLFDPSPPRPAELRGRYQGEGYFVKRDGGDRGPEALWGYPTDYLADRPMVEAKFAQVLGHLERYVEPGRLLDVGSGPGFMLAAARRRGWEAVGVELNEWAVAYGRDELGLDIRVGDLAEAGLGSAELDALTMMDVIEHVPDPDALVAEAARVVRPGGAVAVLTPDSGSPVSRALGRRWPEARRPGEHPVLFSVAGLSALLARHGFAASGWHSVGKTASLATLVADVSPAAPRLAARTGDWMRSRALGGRVVELDPRTKLCLYARRLPPERRLPGHRPARIPKRSRDLVTVEAAILSELEDLGAARRYCDWMFDQFAPHVRGAVAEIGAGIGTFSRRILDGGAERLLAIEPAGACADVLERRLSGDPRVEIARDLLPDAPSLAANRASFDLVVCQNVLEHIGDDEAALGAICGALRPGGRLALLVPAGPRLFGPLDEAYGHWRRYRADELRAIVAGSGLEVESVRPVNALGIPGWWAKNRLPGARIGAASLRLYEALVAAWRPLEERLHPAHGLSLVCLARKPPGTRS